MTRLAAQERHAQSALEWPLLLDRIAGRCTSQPAAERLRALLPADTVPEARRRLERQRDACLLFEAGHPLPVRAFEELGASFERVRADGIASGAELWALAEVLSLASDLRRYSKAHAESAPALSAAVASDPALDRLRERLCACIDAHGDVLDRASPELSRARAKVQDSRADLKRRLTQLIGRFGDLLQGQYYTEREGRFVLPVRSDAHLRVDGIVFGSSASGSTLFVEPRELTQVGNAVRVAEAESAREEARVLCALSCEVKLAHAACETAYEACIVADSLHATTRWAHETQSVVPVLEARASLELRDARHPLLLLTEVQVVPNDILLSSGRALVISGPNAGGKTVALKTAGLVALMVRAGLPIPVRADSVVGFFERVLCDIGDEQSIVRSLSTFSAHIANLAAILECVTPSCLVLLDELAAGTDPEEGAALAAAVLEELTRLGAAVGVTTHYERLKELATQHRTFGNASVGFDFEAMAPTFQLHLGVPGPSSALAVAVRHGLQPSLIERAKALLPTAAVNREAALRELSRARAELAALQREAETDRTQASELRETLEAERHAVRERDARDAEREVSELRLAVQKARKELEEVRVRLRNSGADPTPLREVERDLSRVAARVAIGGELEAQTRKAPEHAGSDELKPSEVRVGCTVRHRTLGATGQIIELCSRDQVRLLIGGMKLLVPTRDLCRNGNGGATTERHRAKPSYRSVTQPKPSSAPQRSASTTLDLRGERVDEALSRVEAFIDRLLGMNEVGGFVLHGHGTGALKASVREHLRASTYVEQSRPAEADEGGDAFTVFWLRG